MSADGYLDRLKRAAWNWLERHDRRNGKPPKDRRMGRREKRSARNADRVELRDTQDTKGTK